MRHGDLAGARGAGGNMVSPMTSIYDLFARDCAKIAAKTKKKSDKAHLLRLAKQWQMVATEQEGEIGKSAVFPMPALQAPERDRADQSDEQTRTRAWERAQQTTEEDAGAAGASKPLRDTARPAGNRCRNGAFRKSAPKGSPFGSPF